MKIFAFAFFLLVIPLSSFSQEDMFAQSRFSVKLLPLSFYPGFAGPSVRASVEYKLKNNFSLENEGGIFFYYSKGYTAGIELKYYTNEYGLTGGRYFSAELFYKNQAYNARDSISAGWTDFHVTKNVECLTFKYGNTKIYDSGFIFEAFTGLGVRFQQNQNSLSADENDQLSGKKFQENRMLHQAGNRVYPNFVASIKIGWRIKG